MRYYFMFTKKAKGFKWQYPTLVGGQSNLVFCIVGGHIRYRPLLEKNNLEIFITVNTNVPHDPASLLLILSEK